MTEEKVTIVCLDCGAILSGNEKYIDMIIERGVFHSSCYLDEKLNNGRMIKRSKDYVSMDENLKYVYSLIGEIRSIEELVMFYNNTDKVKEDSCFI